MIKVSVIIPTYNRFKYLMNTIDSIKKQTYSNIEIIVINDRSKQGDYYNYNWSSNNITIIHLEKNTKDIFGYACAGYVRNKGIEKTTGESVPYKFSKPRTGDTTSAYADIRKIENKMGWKAKYSLEAALQIAWNWEKEIDKNS